MIHDSPRLEVPVIIWVHCQVERQAQRVDPMLIHGEREEQQLVFQIMVSGAAEPPRREPMVIPCGPEYVDYPSPFREVEDLRKKAAEGFGIPSVAAA